MGKGLLSIIILSIFSLACPPSEVKGEPTQVIQKDKWVLKVWVTAKGTRSEGHTTHLYHNNKEVCPVEGQNTLKTPLGKLKYIENSKPWGWHGWKMSEKRIPIIKS